MNRKSSMGRGTNNLVDMKELVSLMQCAINRNLWEMKVMGDLKRIIDWMNDVVRMENLGCMALGLSLKTVYALFKISISIMCIMKII
jgi:hypothetical protein